MNARSWFQDTITVAAQTGSDPTTGKPTFGTPTPILGAVKSVLRRMQTAAGTVVATVSVFMTDQPIASGMQFWLPGANTSDQTQSRRLGNVTSQHNKEGYTLYQVDL